MENLPTNAADLVVIGVLLISGLLALSRGLVHEVLSVAGWIGALLAAVYGFSFVQPYARQMISFALAADAVAGASLFIVTLVTLSILSHAIARHVQQSALGPVDHSLGFLFGLLRGAVLICAAYLLVIWILPKPEQPQWLRSARTMPLIERGAKLILDVVPEETLRQGEKHLGEMQNRVDGEIESEKQKMFEQLTSPAPAPEPGDSSAPGYKGEERSNMNRLFETNAER